MYNFYGWEKANNVCPIEKYKYVDNLLSMYDVLSNLWCKETCAPRMRENWSVDIKSLGQCSITAFLIQDIFGGEVYGIKRDDGNFHCYNQIDGINFDLTSEQFGDEVLTYDNKNKQYRETHFLKEEKKNRYLYLKKLFHKKCDLMKGEQRG